jgi:phosphatidylinositol glycan class T
LHKAHYTTFPRSIGYVTETFKAYEWHLSFTQGRWFTERWGKPPTGAGTGVQLWAWLVPSNGTSVGEQWKGLANSLSGLFCASLNFVGDVNTVKPMFTFHQRPSRGMLRFASLPREASCTENLTPWMKLLPCQSRAGVARLLNPYRLYDADFHSLSVDMLVDCLDNECQKRRWTLQQTVTVVLDPKRPIFRRDWTVYSLFDVENIEVACASASSSEILLHHLGTFAKNDTKLGESTHGYQLTPMRTNYDMKKLGVTWIPHTRHDLTQVPVHVHRSLTGWGMAGGGIVVSFTNSHSEDWKVSYLDALPWFVEPFLHTLKFSHPNVLLEQRLEPSKIRSRPTTMEFILRIPANTTFKMTYEFEKAHLRYTEHPPDAHRGFDIAPGIMTLLSGENQDSEFESVRLYTESLLVSLPTPDFSMPYNVITLTSTVIALFFGNMFNLLIRKFIPVVVLVKKSTE